MTLIAITKNQARDIYRLDSTGFADHNTCVLYDSRNSIQCKINNQALRHIVTHPDANERLTRQTASGSPRWDQPSPHKKRSISSNLLFVVTDLDEDNNN